MGEHPREEYVLGIDLGTNSLGWAIVGLVDGEPAKLVQAGARVFEAGMEGDIESGREESRNKARRDARLHRRQLWRHRRRLVKVAHILQRGGLLPDGDVSDPEARQEFFNGLDASILGSAWFAAKYPICGVPRKGRTKEQDAEVHRFHQLLPYILRAAALDEKLEPQFLGRAIYHLAQRRGFWSNRKQVAKKDDDEGKVKEGIAELRKAMAEANARTLGEYFSRLSPSEERIRSRWTARDMYEKEFDAIWAAQSAHHPNLLTEGRKKELRKAIFYQRPLWFDPNTIGQCELEAECRHAPAYLLVAQRLRLLQTVNNLRLLPPGEPETPLTPADRKRLIDELELKGDLKFDKIRKLLGLEKEYLFTLERGGEKTIKGNRTNADFYKVFGEHWLTMTPEERDRAVEYVHAFQKPDKLREAAKKHFGLDDKSAEKLADISLEPDYMNHSRRAIEKLLPLLEQGATYGETRKEIYPESFRSGEAKPLLPPVEQALEIRNPAVTRSLTELRKVTNAVVRQYGKPQEIRIELARDLKRSKKDRQGLIERNRDNEEARERMKKKILEQVGLTNPGRTDIRKALLHEECGGICPYTGKPIDFRHLFGPEPQFDIEHIIPRERSFENSFSNLTLCDNHENRHVKGKKTPWEAYHADESRYEEILDRVKRFHSPSARAKLWRFQMTETQATEFVSKFIDRQLNDTRYASKLAATYVAMLYGGLSDDKRLRRVHVTSGEVTAHLRGSWLLNGILNDGPTAAGGEVAKTREDHRHHAVDAVAIALTDDSAIQQLSLAWQEARDLGKRTPSLKAPWGKDLAEFVDSVRGEIDKIVVSHRVSKKVSGALHKETIYSRPFPVAAVSDRRPRSRKNGGEDTAATAVRVRKPLASLTKPELEQIADEGVKKLVLKKLEELGGGEPKKAFSNQANLPKFPQSGVLIKRVRITKAERPMIIGQGRTQRHVISGNNHHVEIYAELDKNGNEGKWDGEVVPMHEAYQRIKAGKSVVQRDHGPLVKFKFSLAKGDTVELQGAEGRRELFVVRKIGPQVSLIAVNDARRIEKYFSPRINGLFTRGARKLVVSPLGEISDACD